MSLARRSRQTLDIWPGFVDALATLLMVIIFLLSIFIVAQFYMNDALMGRDKALQSLNQQVADLAELLNLERKSNTGLRRDLAELSSELQSSLSLRDEMQSNVTTLSEQLSASKRALDEQQAAPGTEMRGSVGQERAVRLEAVGAAVERETRLERERAGDVGAAHVRRIADDDVERRAVEIREPTGFDEAHVQVETSCVRARRSMLNTICASHPHGSRPSSRAWTYSPWILNRGSTSWKSPPYRFFTNSRLGVAGVAPEAGVPGTNRSPT